MRISFDQGTLLLTEAPDQNARSLPGVMWDPRVRAWRAPAWRWRALRSAIGADVEDAIRARMGPRAPFSPPPLRPYQAVALEMSVAPFRLGLTATPPADEAQLERLAQLVGPVVFRLSVDDLAGRYLAGYERVELELDLRPDERLCYEREMTAFRDVYRPFTRAVPGASWTDCPFARSRRRLRTLPQHRGEIIDEEAS